MDGEAGGECAGAVFVHRMARERDGGDAFEAGHAAQLGEERVAVNARHADVGDDEAGRFLSRARDGLERGTRAHHVVAAAREEHLQKLDRLGGVVHDEDGQRRGVGLVLARLVLGAGEGAVYTAGSAWIVDLSPPERRGRVLGLYGLAVWGGLAVGPLLGSLIHNAAGYEEVWLLAALLPLAGALAGLAIGDPFVPLAHAQPHPLVAPEAVRPGIAVGLAAIGYATVAAFVVLLLEKRGIDQGAAVFAAFAGAIVLGRLVLGDLPDRFGPAPVAIAATVTEATGLLAIAVAGSLPVALLGGIAMGTGFALLNPSLMLIVVDQVSAAARGAALGTFTAFFDLGVGVGAPLAGLAAALTTYEGAFLLASALALASAAMIYLTVHGRALIVR